MMKLKRFLWFPLLNQYQFFMVVKFTHGNLIKFSSRKLDYNLFYCTSYSCMSASSFLGISEDEIDDEDFQDEVSLNDLDAEGSETQYNLNDYVEIFQQNPLDLDTLS